MFRHIFFIWLLASQMNIFGYSYLSIAQLNYVRNILINPNTRSDIRIKTKEILVVLLKKNITFIEVFPLPFL